MPAKRFALAHLTALSTPPVELVTLAAGAGYWAVGLRLHPVAPDAIHYPLRRGSPELAEMKARMKATGIRVYDVEIVQLTPDIDLPALLPMLETAAELGAERLNVAGDDPDFSRLAANFAALAEHANEFGLTLDLEFMRWRPVGALGQAVEIVNRSGAANAAVLLDTLHLARSGGTAADVAKLRKGLIQSVQIADAPRADPGDAGIVAEARGGRLPPGHGALPIREILACLPDEIDVSIEAPSPPQPGVTPLARLTALRLAADDLLRPIQRRASA